MLQEKMASTLRSLLNAATSSLPRKCITSSILFSTGDSISQHVFERKRIRDHDLMRSARIAFHGGVVFAPILNAWFTVLNRIKLSNKITQTFVRVVADQFIGGPFFPAIFYTSMTLLEGGSIQDVQEKLQKAWFKTWCVGVLVFTPASIINLSVIAPQNRVLFMNSVGLSWGVYLAYSNNTTHKLQPHTPILSTTEAIRDHELATKKMV